MTIHKRIDNMEYAHLNRQVFQTQCQALLQRSRAGVVKDDSIRVNVDAIGIYTRALGLDESNALLHCAVILCKAECCCVWSLTIVHVPSLEFESLSPGGGTCRGRPYRFNGMDPTLRYLISNIGKLLNPCK
jgi:hypothetical protein